MNNQQAINKLSLQNNSLIGLFLHSVAQYPHHNALWVEGTYYTYAELYDLAEKLSSVICEFECERVVLFTNRSITSFVSIIGTLMAGKIYVPISPNIPVENNICLLNTINDGIIIIDEENEKFAEHLLMHINRPMIVLFPQSFSLPAWAKILHKNTYFTSKNINRHEHKRNFPCNFNKYATLFFTSGTTGTPKGIMVSHLNILRYIRSFVERSGATNQDRFSQISELTFDFSTHEIFSCWSVGGTLFVLPTANSLKLYRFINDHQITYMATVPSNIFVIKRLGKLKKQSFPSLRHTTFGGESLSKATAREWSNAAPFSVIDNIYGPTETTCGVLAYRWLDKNLNNEDTVPIGTPLPEQNVIIIDSSLHILPEGQIGEICISGSQVTDGYWKNSELTDEKFNFFPDRAGIMRRWYRTGDLGLLTDGNIVYKGRIDDQIQVLGCRVERIEIENAIKSIASTELVAVIPFSGPDSIILGTTAFICDSNLSTSEILQKCRKQLPSYMIPRNIFFINELPLTNNGKIDYKKLTNLSKNFYKPSVGSSC